MRTALLAVTLLCLTGCSKTIHEAAAPAGDPPRDQVAVGASPTVR
jgi:hypothetical protein